MFPILRDLLDSLVSASAKKVMVGAGLTLVNAAGTMILIQFLVGKIGSSLGDADGDLLALISLCGLDTFMSIITGAMVAAVTLDKAKIRFAKDD